MSALNLQAVLDRARFQRNLRRRTAQRQLNSASGREGGDQETTKDRAALVLEEAHVPRNVHGPPHAKVNYSGAA
ncbi:hypothetical protein ANO11243_087590 [Dothideomycetidae sp. 11243]|nr:hypothetical protein ANO11243_087590 [fungal sp. No.11243]